MSKIQYGSAVFFLCASLSAVAELPPPSPANGGAGLAPTTPLVINNNQAVPPPPSASTNASTNNTQVVKVTTLFNASSYNDLLQGENSQSLNVSGYG